MFHSGHANLLRHCKKLSDKVVVALNTDDFVQQFKSDKPVISYDDRRKVLLSCRYVDEVIENSCGLDSKPTILKVKPDIIAIGDDWRKRDYYEQMSFSQEWLDSNDITLVYIPYTAGISATEIKQRIT